MNKKIIAKNILARANSTLRFLEHSLKYKGMKANDIIWQRSILIMLSYSFELIIKSELVFTSKNIGLDEIDKELRGFGHDIQKILIELNDRGSLPFMKIKEYKIKDNKGFKQYTITLKDKSNIAVEDFVDIRYDYTKTTLRDLIDHDIIIEYIDKMIELSKNVNVREGSL